MMVLGRIAAPFGIKGWVKIQPFGDDPLSWANMPEWWIAPDAETPPEQWRITRQLGCREHGNGVIAHLDASPDRNAAEALKGWFIGAPREAMPEPDVDEYYWGDLIGLKVENLDGHPLGEVTGLLSTGAHDVLRVIDGESERLIPFVAAYVTEVDHARRRIRVDWQPDW